MKIKKTKRLLALILCMALVLGTNTFTMAAGAGQTQEESLQEQENISQEEILQEPEENSPEEAGTEAVQAQALETEEIIEEEPQEEAQEQPQGEEIQKDSMGETEEAATEDDGQGETAETNGEENVTENASGEKEGTLSEISAEETLSMEEENDNVGLQDSSEENCEVSEVKNTLPAFEGTYNDEQIKVSVYAEEGTFPEGTTFQMSSVTDEAMEQNFKDQATAFLEEKGLAGFAYSGYEMDFLLNGEEIQPADEKQVNISIEYIEGVSLENLPEETEINLFHMTDNGLENVQVNVEKENTAIKKIDFTANSFSPYFLVWSQKIQEQEEYDLVTTSFTEVGPFLEPVVIPSKVKAMAANASDGGSGDESEEDNGLELTKTAKENEDGTYQIQLEAYTTGAFTQDTVSVPTDFILVLDQSSSMDQTISSYTYTPIESFRLNRWQTYYIELNGVYKAVTYQDNMFYRGWGYFDGRNFVIVDPDEITFYQRKQETTTKMEALKAAVTAFINNVKDNATESKVTHRIAMVGFGIGTETNWGRYPEYYNTEVFIGGDEYNYGSRDIEWAYNNAFQTVGEEKGYQNLLDSVNVLEADGATNADLGLKMANQIFAKDNYTGTRNRVVLMFTDGEPSEYSGTSYRGGVGERAIQQSYYLKQAYNPNVPVSATSGKGATVYSVGVFGSGVNPDPGDVSKNINRYMNYVSSNYPNASGWSEWTSGGNKGYYLTADDEEALIEIFEKISENIKPSIALDETTQIKDVVSEYFKLPDNISRNDIKVTTAEYRGNGTWEESPQDFNDASINIDQENGTVTVSNFNFDENVVVEENEDGEPQGKKLIITFNVERQPGFIGGNGVFTNDDSSGVYKPENGSEELIEKFEKPAVDVSLRYDFDPHDHSIYVGENWNEVLKFFDDVNRNGIQYKIENETYTVGGIYNDYVDITYTVRNSKNEIVGVYEISKGDDNGGSWKQAPNLNTSSLENDQGYTITVEVKPDEGAGSIESITVQKIATLHVFKPTFICSDEKIFIGESTNLNDRVQVKEWKCDCTGEKLEVARKLLPSDEPDLSYEFELKAGTEIGQSGSTNYSPEEDSDFSVKFVKNGDVDITRNCKFESNPQKHDENCITHDGEEEEHHFTIHVLGGSIEIYKKIEGDVHIATEGTPVFTFKITRPDGLTTYETIQFETTTTDYVLVATLNKLPKGTYTIQELNTQRYDKTEISSEGTIAKVEEQGEKTAKVTIGERQPGVTSDGEPVKGIVRYTNIKNSDPGSLTDTDVVVNKFTYTDKGYTFSGEEPDTVKATNIIDKAADFISGIFH